MKWGPIDPKKIILTEDEEIALAYIINTLEYCDSMIPSLEELVNGKIDETYKDKIEFTNSKDTFAKAINVCIEWLLSSLDAKLKDQFKKVYSVSWASFVKV